MLLEEIKFQSFSRELVQTLVKFRDQFPFTPEYFQVFHMNFKIYFRHLMLLEMISSEKILKQSHRSLQYDVNNLDTKFLITYYSTFWRGTS